jgi:hypothetical protein
MSPTGIVANCSERVTARRSSVKLIAPVALV